MKGASQQALKYTRKDASCRQTSCDNYSFTPVRNLIDSNAGIFSKLFLRRKFSMTSCANNKSFSHAFDHLQHRVVSLIFEKMTEIMTLASVCGCHLNEHTRKEMWRQNEEVMSVYIGELNVWVSLMSNSTQFWFRRRIAVWSELRKKIGSLFKTILSFEA